MKKYVALLRGIGPSNPNMHGSKLKWFFEELGFTNVKPVISSGNVVFESSLTSTTKIEETIEQELPKKLGFSSMTIVRSQEHLKSLIEQDPFKGKEHSKTSYLTVTFLKKSPGEIFNSWDTTTTKGPEFMTKLEKEYGKEITTRTWKTISRILKAME